MTIRDFLTSGESPSRRNGCSGPVTPDVAPDAPLPTVRDGETTQAKSSKALSLPVLVLVLLSVAAMAVFVLVGIRKPVTIDEAITIYLSSHGYENIITFLRHSAQAPLFYFLLATWIHVFGMSEVALRLLPGLLYVLSVAAVYFLGRWLFGERKTASLCSFLYLVSPQAVWHAQNVRMYSLLGLLAVLSTFYYLRYFLIETKSRRDLALYVIVNILGTFTHYWFFFVLFSQGAACLFMGGRRSIMRMFAAGFASCLPFAVLWLPILLGQVKIIHVPLDKPGIEDAARILLDMFGGGAPALLVYVAMAVILTVRFRYPRIVVRPFGEFRRFLAEKRVGVFALLFGVSLLLPLLVSQVKPIYEAGTHKYTIILLLPLVMVLGAALSRFAGKHVLTAFCYLLVIGAMAGVAHGRMKAAAPDQYGHLECAEYLVTRAARGDVVIFTHLSRPLVSYYIRRKDTGKGLRLLAFPPEMELRMGVLGLEQRTPEKREGYRREAERLAARLRQSLGDQNHVWLVHGWDREVDHMLTEALDSHLVPVDVKLYHRHDYYRKVKCYRNRRTE